MNILMKVFIWTLVFIVCSVALCDPMDSSMPCPSLSLKSLLKFISIESVMGYLTISSTALFSFCFQSFPDQGLFQWVSSASGGQSIGASASASVLPVNIQDSFPLGFTGLISLQSKGLSRVFSNTTVWKHKFIGVLSHLYGPTLTSMYNYWKNHSFDYMDLCRQSDTSAF